MPTVDSMSMEADAIRPLRIVHVISGLELGGAETMLYRLVEHLDRAACASSVVSMTTEGMFGPRLRALGIPVIALGMPRGLPDPRALAVLVRLLRRDRPDIVQTWMYHADLFGGIAGGLAGQTPVVWGIRHSNLRWGSARVTTILTARLNAFLSHRLPAKIICNSEASRRLHERLGYDSSKLLVIPNGFDLETFRPDAAARAQVRQELGLAMDALLVGIIARFHPQKAYGTFVRAAAYLKSRLPETHFVLAGEGVTPENEELASWIRAAKLETGVHLLGKRLDTPRLFAAMDVFCLSSSHGESFPHVVGEAMACGVPCVVTDVGDAAEIVGPTGLVVAPGDAQGLAEAWGKLIEVGPEERARLGEQARRRISDRYSLQSVVSRYQDLYLSLCPRDEQGPESPGPSTPWPINSS